MEVPAVADVQLESARADYDRGDWSAAYAGWSAADPGLLSAEELEDFAVAAELTGHHDDTIAALQRAFRKSQEAADLGRSVRCAFRITMTSYVHGESALARGWTSRAEGLVTEAGEDAAGAAVGWVDFLRMFRALGTGDYATAGTYADRVAERGRRHAEPDLTALGLCAQGRMAIYSGRVVEGLARLDEAMVRVIAGEASPVVAGHVYCTAIEGCQEISDFGRVAEWTAALERWCAAQPGLLAFTGQCAVHRGQLLRLHGEWQRALEEFEHATRRYREVNAPDAVGLAAYEAGEVLRLRGEYAEADAAYERAADSGFDPQPGLALLWSARGEGAAALAAIDRLLAETGWGRAAMPPPARRGRRAGRRRRGRPGPQHRGRAGRAGRTLRLRLAGGGRRARPRHGRAGRGRRRRRPPLPAQGPAAVGPRRRDL
ncbi:transcriptional regulator, LuxR family [Nocardioidaceae bacterium Broad-1]|nr:transcriptional regulator, LuxR family [Nocardioidaceae bacterium Broad-1]